MIYRWGSKQGEATDIFVHLSPISKKLDWGSCRDFGQDYMPHTTTPGQLAMTNWKRDDASDVTVSMRGALWGTYLYTIYNLLSH